MIEIFITIASLTVGYLIGWYVSGYLTYQRNLDKKIKADHKLLTKPTGYFNLFKDKGKNWRFNILASNFKVIAVSEGYTSRRNAILGIKSVHRSCQGIIRFRERKNIETYVKVFSEVDRKSMQTIMKKGGLVMNNTNKPIGKIINYEFKEESNKVNITIKANKKYKINELYFGNKIRFRERK